MFKKLFFTIICLTATLLVMAQESESMEPTHEPFFTDTMKMYWLGAVVALSLFFTIRTFRNKPDA